MALGTSIARGAILFSEKNDSEYFQNCLKVRSTGRVGSWYEGFDPHTLREALVNAGWYPSFHPAVKEPGISFRVDNLPGRLGIVALVDLPDDTMLTLLDPKGGEEFWTGERSVGATVSASRYGLEAPSVGHTTLIIGPSVPGDVKSAPTLWTFHPGDPVRPSEVGRMKDGEDLNGKVLSVAEARAMGFDYAKLVD